MRRPPRWLRDPLLSLANTPKALVATVVVTWAGMALLVGCALEGWGLTQAAYWSMTTMSTVGYGDVSPASALGRWLTIGYQAWALFFLLPFAIYHVADTFVTDVDEWSHEEQVQLRADLAEIRSRLNHLCSKENA